MKKSIITALMILMIITASVIPFSVKASSELVTAASGQIAKGNDIIGNYNTYNYVADAQTNQINVDIEGIVTDAYTGGSLHVFTFNDFYYGQIVITLSNLNYMAFVFVEGQDVGTYVINSTAKTVTVNLVGCSYFKIYTLSVQSNTSRRTTGVTGYNASSLELYSSDDMQAVISAINTIGDYNIPQVSLPAYIFSTSISNPVVFNPGNFAPYVKVDAGGTTRQAKYIRWDPNDREAQYHFVVIANVVLSSSNVSSQNGNVNLVFNTGIYDFGNYSVTDIQINGVSGTLLNPVTDRLVYGRTIYMYPLYYGRGYDMPDEYRRMLGWQTKQDHLNETVDFIRMTVDEILQYLWDDQGASNDVDDTTDAVIDLQDQEHDITDSFTSDLNDFNTNMNLNDFNFTSLFMDANNYFKNQLDTVYTESSGFQAFWVIPIILIILRVLLGGTV